MIVIPPDRAATTADVAGHYDELDRFYRRLWGEHVHHGLWLTGKESPEVATEQLLDRVAEHLQVEPNQQLCDVGCGYGGTSRYFAERFEANVTGFTVSPAQHQYASDLAGDTGNPNYLLCNWEKNELPSESIDRLVSIECISHVEDKTAFFEQVARVLKPGGRAVVIAWLAKDKPKHWERVHLLEPICREGRLPSMGSATDYEKLIDEFGLQLVGYSEFSKQVARTWSICGWRVVRALLTQPDSWRYLLWQNPRHAVFILTVWRILAAYRTGAMQYGMFVITKPEVST